MAAQDENSQEPTLRTNPNIDDLGYVPQAKPMVYAPPKVPLTQKVLQQVKKFWPGLLILTVFVLILIYAINYFNFIPLSSLYPKVFSMLPHRYDHAGNKAALATAPKFGNSKTQIITAELYRVREGKITVMYQERAIEFLTYEGTNCFKRNFEDEDVCANVLISKNYGQDVNLIFFNKENYYFISHASIN